MVGKVEAAVHPDAVLRDGYVFLGVNRPCTLGGDLQMLVVEGVVGERASRLTFVLWRRCRLAMVGSVGEQKQS